MVWDILSVCGWPIAGSRDDAPKAPRVTLVQEQSGVDGSFLLAMLMTNHLKRSVDNRVLLFAGHHNAAHYTAACQKLTFNTASAIQSGHLRIVDVLAELYNGRGSTGGPELLQLISTQLAEAQNPNTLIIVDDLTLYATVHPVGGENSVIDFVEQRLLLQTLASDRYFVLKVNASECYERFCTCLNDLADVVVDVGPLPSGSFHELDGILTVHRKQSSAYPLISTLRDPPKTLLYKVHDRLVRTYVPGEVGIKNL
uniref:Elongator complex protein 6 n=1 Tax=Anopheles epiroticus TaxID=199890 RepID=A0A182P2X6_9DIPT